MAEDFRVLTSWRTHPKRLRLQRSLGADGVVAVLDLWSFCASTKPSGRLTGMTDQDIELVVGWSGEPGILVETLAELRILDGDEGKRMVHGWAKSNPYVAASTKRSLASKKAAHARWKKKRGCAGGTQFCDVTCGSMRPALPSHAIRNAPDPIPIPDPIPDPDPEPPHPKSSSSGLVEKDTGINTGLPEPKSPAGYAVADLEPLAWHFGWRNKLINPAQLMKAETMLKASGPWTRQQVEWARHATEERNSARPNLGLFLCKLEDIVTSKPHRVQTPIVSRVTGSIAGVGEKIRRDAGLIP